MSFSSTRATAPHSTAVVNPHEGEPDDALVALVRAAQAGSTDGLRQFLVAVAPAVRRTCRGVLGGDHADLEDTIQDSLFAAVKALPHYRFDGDVRRYVGTIALRMAISARRRSADRRRRHASIEVHQIEASTSGEATDSLVDGMVLVRRILDELGRVQSEALLMRMILGLSIEEIAAKTGVSPNTVKTRLRRGKNTLRENGESPGFWKRLFLRSA